jgi:NADPH:quinone reductase-like Zn-dependent oxidoreductase
MKLRNKILTVVAATLVLAIAALAVVLSYDKPCTPQPTVAAGVETMRAVSYTCYGGPEVLEVARIGKPAPAANQVLVRVHRAGVNPLDWHFMRGSPYIMRLGSGLGAPNRQRLGVDFAGTIEAVGTGVKRFRPGDGVFGGAFGAFGEYVVLDADGSLAPIPAGVDFDQAAGVSVAAVTALQALRDKGQLLAGQSVLINGASGGVGTFAVQIAKAMGAEVTGVCSTRNVELVRSLGADQVIDYTKEDYTRASRRWDLIVDNVGNRSVLENRDVLTDTGRYVIVGGAGGDWLGPLARPLWATLVNTFVDQDLVMLLAQQSRTDLETLAGMLASGQLRTVIDRHYDLDDVAEAIRHSESGHARGKIIIDVTD